MVRKGETKRKSKSEKYSCSQIRRMQLGKKEEEVESCTQPLFAYLSVTNPPYLGVPRHQAGWHSSSYRFTSSPDGNPHSEGKAIMISKREPQQQVLAVPYWDGSMEKADFETVFMCRVLLELEGVCCSCLLASWYQVSGNTKDTQCW